MCYITAIHYYYYYYIILDYDIPPSEAKMGTIGNNRKKNKKERAESKTKNIRYKAIFLYCYTYKT